jgi:hypothetical protein
VSAFPVARFLELDRRLAAAGFPPLSPFWREVLTRFLGTSKRQLVLRVGRRGGKSLSACKIAVAFALMKIWKVAPGERAVVALVSVSMQEAQSKVRLIREMLRALRVKVARETALELELADSPVTFRCVAANARTAVGFSCVLCLIDEAARLRDDESGTNPCREIVATLRPSLLTMRGSRLLLISSPVGLNDFHAQEFARGDTRMQMVAQAASWVANPSLTEQETHDLEDDPRVWSREFAAVPQAGALSAFPAEDVERAFVARGDIVRTFDRACAIDASSGARDLFAYSIGGWRETQEKKRALMIDELDTFSPEVIRSVGIETVIDRIAGRCRALGCRVIFGDQREQMMIGAAFRRRGLYFVEKPWTASSKARAVSRLRRWMLEGALSLPPNPELKREMHVFEERVGSDGQINFSGAHAGDRLATLLTLALADEEHGLRGSPLEPAPTVAPGQSLVCGRVGPSSPRFERESSRLEITGGGF